MNGEYKTKFICEFQKVIIALCVLVAYVAAAAVEVESPVAPSDVEAVAEDLTGAASAQYGWGYGGSNKYSWFFYVFCAYWKFKFVYFVLIVPSVNTRQIFQITSDFSLDTDSSRWQKL